jgi:hypothetical protein
MTKQNSLQTTLIHAPRQAPQYIETIQPQGHGRDDFLRHRHF